MEYNQKTNNYLQVLWCKKLSPQGNWTSASLDSAAKTQVRKATTNFIDFISLLWRLGVIDLKTADAAHKKIL